MKILSGILFIFVLTIFLSSCARIRYKPAPNVQRGLASWYGPGFHGKTTSSQEIFNMHDMTAAHRSLAFGTYVIVTNLNNGKSVTVRINDRGPFIKGRIIDLSYAAAKVIGIIGPGVASVKLEPLPGVPVETSTQKFSVQVGAFILNKNAIHLKKKLQKNYKGVYISIFKTSHQTYYRVRIKAKSLDIAERIALKLNTEGFTVFLLEKH